MRHNLGADTSLDPDVPVQAIHGNYYQWGRSDVVADASTPPGPITGWNTINAPNGSWSDITKAATDPCPSGFRVPTSQQWNDLINNNTATNVGPFVDSPTNFGSAKVWTGGENKLTFPTAGYRESTAGILNTRGSSGYYWSSTQNISFYTYYMNFFGSSVDMIPDLSKVDGFSIRCIEELTPAFSFFAARLNSILAGKDMQCLLYKKDFF